MAHETDGIMVPTEGRWYDELHGSSHFTGKEHTFQGGEQDRKQHNLQLDQRVSIIPPYSL